MKIDIRTNNVKTKKYKRKYQIEHEYRRHGTQMESLIDIV